jgi:hypothetical protein
MGWKDKSFMTKKWQLFLINDMLHNSATSDDQFGYGGLIRATRVAEFLKEQKVWSYYRVD